MRCIRLQIVSLLALVAVPILAADEWANTPYDGMSSRLATRPLPAVDHVDANLNPNPAALVTANLEAELSELRREVDQLRQQQINISTATSTEATEQSADPLADLQQRFDQQRRRYLQLLEEIRAERQRRAA